MEDKRFPTGVLLATLCMIGHMLDSVHGQSHEMFADIDNTANPINQNGVQTEEQALFLLGPVVGVLQEMEGLLQATHDVIAAWSRASGMTELMVNGIMSGDREATKRATVQHVLTFGTEPNPLENVIGQVPDRVPDNITQLPTVNRDHKPGYL